MSSSCSRGASRNGGGKIFVDYSSLDVRHLGSIYEGLLEYQLHVADGPLALDGDEYVEADESDEVTVEAGEVYLTTGSGERKATGSYYTPEYVVEYIVDETLGPLVDDIREDLVGYDSYSEGGFAEEFAERVFELKLLDPAMGSGHFLTSAVDYLAREIIDAQERQAAQQGIETVQEDHDINWARRKVAQRCIYGVDRNPLATELAKVSLWLRTLAAEQPLAFLDHHLKTGNSLVGSDIEDVLANGDGSDTGDGQLTLEQSFAHTRQQALEHVMDRFQSLLAIDNETLEDAKEMEDVYDAVREDPLYRHLLAMANVHTAERFGLDVPSDADKRMAEALRADSWSDIEAQDWFISAQLMAADERFFHWELEFPVAFYDEDGGRKADAGFDAVIGNPPYVSPENQTESIRSYLTDSELYPSTHGRFDIYLCFMDRSIYLVKDGGLTSMIIPYPHLYENYAKKFRHRQLFDLKTNRILDLSNQEVFENVGVRNIIQTLENTKSDGYSIEISHGERESKSIQDISNPVSVENSLFKDIYNNRIRVNLDSKDTEILQKVQGQIFTGDFYYVCRGLEIYSVDAGNTKGDRIHDTKQTARDKPYIEGKEVVPWTIPSPSRYIDYEPSKMKRPRFPELFENEKLLIQDVVGDNGLAVALDDTGMYCDNTINCCVKVTELDDDKMRNTDIPTGTEYRAISEIPNECILAQWNSSLVSYYYKKLIESGLHVYPSDIRQIPVYLPSESSIESIQKSELPKQSTIKITDASEKELLGWLSGYTKQRIEYTHNRVKLNLNLPDYLGNYEDGPDLPDVGLFQPSESNVLDATTEEYEKLRVGDVRAERDGTSVTIFATARYKPEDEDAHETDTYGYTETEFVEAFTLVDCSEREAALVAAFVPVAVDDEIAGFRENATKTNSLVDRLKAITLPNPDDVADDLERYIETKERADELDAKIEETDRLIDEIVYDLYDLTGEEIEIVKSAVADD
nr:TaqI-like C-terminal specificity domain-containing protein [Halorubrum sp. 48-1-W]